jgi:hypothetical protein
MTQHRNNAIIICIGVNKILAGILITAVIAGINDACSFGIRIHEIVSHCFYHLRFVRMPEYTPAANIILDTKKIFAPCAFNIFC